MLYDKLLVIKLKIAVIDHPYEIPCTSDDFQGNVAYVVSAVTARS
jgi:hypothetical protein